MTEESDQRFVDHPAPSIGLFTLFVCIITLLAGLVPVAIGDIPREELGSAAAIGVYAVMIFSIGIMSFYMWPIYTTYYIVDKKGITVKYGPWTHESRWDDFETVYWQKGMFVSKIGWPSVTPCCRLSNGLVLTRKRKIMGTLYYSK